MSFTDEVRIPNILCFTAVTSQMCGTGKSSTSDIITLVQTDTAIPPMRTPNISLCGSLQAFTVSLLKIIYYSQVVIVSLAENVTK